MFRTGLHATVGTMRQERSRPQGPSADSAVVRRDLGLRRLRRLTGAVAATAAVAVGGLSALAAAAKPGATKHPVAVAQRVVKLPAPVAAHHARRRHHRRHRATAAHVAPPAAAAVPVQPAPAPQPAPVAPQPTVAPPVASSGGS
jgi:hypothetical protein